MLGKNALIFGLGNIVLRLVAFIPIPYYTRYFTTNEYGLLETLLLTIQLLVVLMSIGMVTTFTRFFSEHSERNTVGKLMGSSLAAVTSSGIVTTLFFVFLVSHSFNSILHVESSAVLLALSCGAAFMQSVTLLVLNYFRARNEAFRFSMISAFLALLILIFIFIFIGVFKMRVEGVLLAQISAYFIAFTTLAIYIFPKIRPAFSLRIFKEIISFGFPLIFAMCGWLIMRISDRYFLGYFHDLSVVGIYSLGLKVASVLGIFLARPFELAYFPYLFSKLDDPENLKTIISRTFSHLTLISILAGFGIIMFSEEIVRIIGTREYHTAYKAIIYAVPVFLFDGLLVWILALVHIKKKTRVIGVVLSVSTVLNLLLNYLLVPGHGWQGAILSTFISKTISVVILFSYALKYQKVKFETKKLKKILYISVILLVFSLLSFNISKLFLVPAIVLIPSLPFIIGFFTSGEKEVMRAAVNSILGGKKSLL